MVSCEERISKLETAYLAIKAKKSDRMSERLTKDEQGEFKVNIMALYLKGGKKTDLISYQIRKITENCRRWDLNPHVVAYKRF